MRYPHFGQRGRSGRCVVIVSPQNDRAGGGEKPIGKVFAATGHGSPQASIEFEANRSPSPRSLLARQASNRDVYRDSMPCCLTLAGHVHFVPAALAATSVE